MNILESKKSDLFDDFNILVEHTTLLQEYCPIFAQSN